MTSGPSKSRADGNGVGKPTAPGVVAIVMAAGKGTRMKSDLPKVLHPVGGRPMVCAVVDACREAGCDRVVLVVGHGQDLVREVFAGRPDVEFAVQADQRGTGDAVRCAKGLLEREATEPGHAVLVLAGDGPLVRASTLRSLVDRHRRTGAAATLATAVIADPRGYGRIVRDAGGGFVGIVEHKNATPEQLKIREVNPSYYCFDGRALFASLDRLGPNVATGEYYITDVLGMLRDEGKRVEVVEAVPAQDVLSINTPEELDRVDRLYRTRADEAAKSAGGGPRPSGAGKERV